MVKRAAWGCLFILAMANALRAQTRQTEQYRKEAPDVGQWNVPLDGRWEFAPEDSTDYQPAPVPGY